MAAAPAAKPEPSAIFTPPSRHNVGLDFAGTSAQTRGDTAGFTVAGKLYPQFQGWRKIDH
jgi:hypothetical protein